jgi:hypothetical protein
MPNYRCDFIVTGDLVLSPALPSLVLSTTAANTTFRNGATDEDGHATNLCASVVGEADSIDIAHSTLRDRLAGQLDLLTFITHSRFKIHAPVRVIEWSPGQGKRRLKAFHKSDARYPPDPEFDSRYIETAELLDSASLEPYTRRALKYFRYGLVDEHPEDQFMRLWLALEIVAENSKGTSRVPISCPHCSASLKCHDCGAEPTRAPGAKRAIAALIDSMAGNLGSAVSKRQFIVRNGLMHGRSTESIELECRASMVDIVNELGTIAWHAICSTIVLRDDRELYFGHRDGKFANRSVLATFGVEFSHDEAAPHPAEDKIPTIEIKLGARFDAHR